MKNGIFAPPLSATPILHAQNSLVLMSHPYFLIDKCK